VGNSQALWPVRPGSMGRPYPGHRAAVIDDDGNEAPRGTPGEVALHRNWFDGTADPVFFLEYWRNPEATAGKYSGDWCRTGDVARMDEEGYLWYEGRSDDMFKVAGYRVGPAEIENCLLRHEAVAMAAAIGVPDALRTEIVKAFVVLRPGHAPSDALARAIQEHVRSRLAAHEYPRLVEFVPELPLTATGKIMRRELRAREAGKR